MFGPSLVAFVSAVTALIASLAGPFVTLYVARAQMRITLRASNRQRWIDEFRDLIARFCSEIAVAAQERDKIVQDGRIVVQNEQEFLSTFGKLVYTANKIRLMINPLDGEHQELLTLVNGLLTLWRTSANDADTQAQGLAVAEKIVAATLLIVRREWLRVQRGG